MLCGMNQISLRKRTFPELSFFERHTHFLVQLRRSAPRAAARSGRGAQSNQVTFGRVRVRPSRRKVLNKSAAISTDTPESHLISLHHDTRTVGQPNLNSSPDPPPRHALTAKATLGPFWMYPALVVYPRACESAKTSLAKMVAPRKGARSVRSLNSLK